MNRLPSGKKKPQVVRPFPLFRSFTSLPSTFVLEDLIALKRRSGGLEDEFCTVEGKIGFSVLPAKGELL